MDVLYIVLIALVIFIFVLVNTNLDEKFERSKGGYVISWDAPSNLQGDVTYNLTITDSNGHSVFSERGITDNSYYFTEGDWDTDYNIEVTATYVNGSTGPQSSVVSFTSPLGFYNPSNIKNLQVLGRNRTVSSGSLYDFSDYDSIDIGDNITSVCLSFDPPSAKLQLWPQVTSDRPVKPIYPYDIKTSVLVYANIVYIPSTAKTIDDCCIFTQAEGTDAGSFILTDGSEWMTFPYEVTRHCDPNMVNGLSKGNCTCPINIKVNDSIAAVMIFVQTYSGTVTSLTRMFSFHSTGQSQTSSTKYSQLSPGNEYDTENFMTKYSDISRLRHLS